MSQVDAAIHIASEALSMQIALGGATLARIEGDRFALGYLYGFHDGITQALGLNQNEEMLTVMTVSYARLFDDQEAGPKLVGTALKLMRDQKFMAGMATGGQEALDFVRNKKGAWGLAGHLRGSN